MVALGFQLPIFTLNASASMVANVTTQRPLDPFSIEILPGLLINVGVIVLNLLESLVGL
jgi:hypothetical protein